MPCIVSKPYLERRLHVGDSDTDAVLSALPHEKLGFKSRLTAKCIVIPAITFMLQLRPPTYIDTTMFPLCLYKTAFISNGLLQTTSLFYQSIISIYYYKTFTTLPGIHFEYSTEYLMLESHRLDADGIGVRNGISFRSRL